MWGRALLPVRRAQLGSFLLTVCPISRVLWREVELLISLTAPPKSTTTHVGTAALGCPAVQSSARFSSVSPCVPCGCALKYPPPRSPPAAPLPAPPHKPHSARQPLQRQPPRHPKKSPADQNPFPQSHPPRLQTSPLPLGFTLPSPGRTKAALGSRLLQTTQTRQVV